MLMEVENPRAVIGGNMPPEPTPYERAEKEVSDLYEEARLWLDGKPITSQAMADDLGNLLNMIRAAEKRADQARAAEKKPHDDAAKAVQARYKPLLERASLAADTCKKALAPWLKKLADEKEAAAKKAREDAEQKAWAAQEAMRAAREEADLAAREEAERLVKEAKRAEKAANKAERSTATAGGAMGRAVGLRTVHVPVMTDAREAARHYWQAAPDEIHALLQTLAERDVRAGKRQIPGFEIREEHHAV